MKKSTLFLLVALINVLPALSQINYRQEFLSLYKTVQQNFLDSSTGFYKDIHGSTGNHKYSYLWPLCGLIQVNNEAEKIGYKKYSVRYVLSAIDKYRSTKPPVPGYDSYIVEYGGGDRFYDDNQWIGLALMDAYFREPQKEYLDKSEEIYHFMMSGFDTASGGGLYWEEGKPDTKNTCSNGPGIILALQLYKATKEKSYLDTALLLYEWVNKNLADKDGLYMDNIKIQSGKVDKTKFSYNTATMLQSNVYLYELTKDKSYLDKAKKIADSSLTYFYGKENFRDGYWFNAVMLRAYQHLLKFSPEKKYINAFIKCANNAIMQNKNSNGLMGKQKPIDLVNQAGMLEILARLAQ